MSTRSLRSRPQLEPEEPPPRVAAAVPQEEEEEEEAEDGEAVVDKEQAIWDALREEHYEAIDQMPLTLVRQFTLMRELDNQARSHLQDLLPAIQAYIHNRTSPSTSTSSLTPTSPSSSLSQTPNRQLLAYIAKLTDDLSDASEEKVNLAQAACDSVDRHMRQIDQAIKEQQAAISLGTNPNSSLAPVILPDLVPVSRWSRPAQVEISDDDDDDDKEREGHAPLANPVNEQGDTVLGVTEDTGKKRSRRPPRNRSHKTDDAGKRSLKILPPKQPGDQEAEVYCFCRRALDDHLIGCDNSTCVTEWFHWSCVGITQPIEGDWFCPECRKTRNRRRK
ncbi:hypothetical protein ONZ45_g9205 [Pleurotus djamor]|nr:hypothetical protein ONZ45_g9205 [Pleurotus djamor]